MQQVGEPAHKLEHALVYVITAHCSAQQKPKQSTDVNRGVSESCPVSAHSQLVFPVAGALHRFCHRRQGHALQIHKQWSQRLGNGSASVADIRQPSNSG